MRDRQSWLLHLKVLPRRSVALGISALAITALIVLAMIESSDYSIVPMSGALMTAALALAIFVPRRVVNFVYALVALIFGLRAAVTGSFLFFITAEETPGVYWAGVSAMFSAALWFGYRGHSTLSEPSGAMESAAHEIAAHHER
jgi:hypothetical protein